jgi:hypothetical protein
VSVCPPHSRIVSYTDKPERQYNDLQASLSVLSVELVPLHQKIVALRKELSVMSAEPKINKAEFRNILEELRKIDQYVYHSHSSIMADEQETS